MAISCSPDTNDGDGDGGTSGSGGTTAGTSGRGGRGGTAGTSGTAGSGAESGMDPGGAGGVGEGGNGPSPGGTGGVGGTAGMGGDGTSGDGMGGSDAGSGGSDAGSGGAEGGAGGSPEPVIEAHYTFDEGIGTFAEDSTGNFPPATLVEGAGWTTGRIGTNALLLNNPDGTTTQHALLPRNVMAQCGDVTIAMWARFDAERPWARLFDADGLVNGFIFFTGTAMLGAPPAPNLFFNIFSTVPANADQGIAGPYPGGTTLVGVWHHYAATIEGGVGRVYFDGVQIGTNPTMTFQPSRVTVAATGNAKVGKSTFAPPVGGDGYVHGAIDDIRIACRAYSAQEIDALVP